MGKPRARKSKELVVDSESESFENDRSSNRNEAIIQVPQSNKECVRAENAKVEAPIVWFTLKLNVAEKNVLLLLFSLNGTTKDG